MFTKKINSIKPFVITFYKVLNCVKVHYLKLYTNVLYILPDKVFKGRIPNILQNIFFCVQLKKLVWNNVRESK